jgi:hypothetical protein
MGGGVTLDVINSFKQVSVTPGTYTINFDWRGNNISGGSSLNVSNAEIATSIHYFGG